MAPLTRSRFGSIRVIINIKRLSSTFSPNPAHRDYALTVYLIWNVKVIEPVGQRPLDFWILEKALLAVFRANQPKQIFSDPPEDCDNHFFSPIQPYLADNTVLFMNDEGTISRDPDEFPLKRQVIIPIVTHEHRCGILALVNHSRGFKFTNKEMRFLKQFIDITAVVLENALMVEEIEQKQAELHFLAGKMITIQEEERRKLASDIHDTIAQALVGVNFKMQTCKELAKTSPDLFVNYLDSVIETVHKTVDQSRELIASLRPDLIDTMGLVAALKRLFNGYSKKTNIRIEAHLPQHIHTPPLVKICLFRVCQEALANVYKHANTDEAQVILKKVGRDVSLTIVDQGRGFQISQKSKFSMRHVKLGLLSMRERVEAVGGKLTVDSGIKGGCRIEARIPIT